MKLKEMLLIVVQKMEKFVNQTSEIKQLNKRVSHRPKTPNNEVIV